MGARAGSRMAALTPTSARLRCRPLGRVAIITGGNAGIGFGIAKGLAAAGAAIVIAGRRAEKNLEAARAIEVFNVKTAALEVDVCQQESCRAMVGNTVERFGRVDILVNNAGIAIRKQPETYTLAEWNRVIDTNLTGAFLCAHAAYLRSPMQQARLGSFR